MNHLLLLFLISQICLIHSILESRSRFSNWPSLNSRKRLIPCASYSTSIKLSISGGAEQSKIQFFIFVGGLCPFAGRTWITLLELGLPFEMVQVDYRNEQRPEAFLQVNPRGRVPALYNPNDEAAVYESAICNEYLCDLENALSSNAKSTLMPSKASERARLRLLNDKFDNDIFPKVRKYIMNEDKALENELLQECKLGLDELEESLGEGPYFMGETFTIADIHVIPFVMRWIVQLRDAKGFDITAKYSKLMRWYQLCQTRHSVQEATIPDDKIIEAHYAKLKFLKSKST